MAPGLKAVLLKMGPQGGHWKAEVDDVPAPEPGYGEIVVEMKACGLCGTDVEKIKGEYTASLPVLGHEAVGVVSAVGGGVGGFGVGERVFPHHHVPCGRCHYCRSGSETMCSDYRKSNLDPGGFAEYFRVPRMNVEAGGVLSIPGAMDLELASLTEPLACCLRALDRVGTTGGETALVVGAGPVGMMHALLLKSRGVAVVVSDISGQRLKFVEGARVGPALDAGRVDVARETRELTGGRGADLAVVASGNPRAIVQALKSVRRGGRVCLFGAPFKGSVIDYDISDAFNAELSVVTSYGATEKETMRALGLLGSGEVDFRALISHRFPLERFGDALEASMGGTSMKVLVTS